MVCTIVPRNTQEQAPHAPLPLYLPEMPPRGFGFFMRSLRVSIDLMEPDGHLRPSPCATQLPTSTIPTPHDAGACLTIALVPSLQPWRVRGYPQFVPVDGTFPAFLSSLFTLPSWLATADGPKESCRVQVRLGSINEMAMCLLASVSLACCIGQLSGNSTSATSANLGPGKL